MWVSNFEIRSSRLAAGVVRAGAEGAANARPTRGCRPPRSGTGASRSSSGSLGAVRISFRVTGSAFGVARRPATSGNRESPSGRAAPDFGVEPVELPVGRDEAEFSPFRHPDLPQSEREVAGGPSRLPRHEGPSVWVSNFEIRSSRPAAASSGRGRGGGCRPARRSAVLTEADGREQVVVGLARRGPDLVPGHRERLRRRRDGPRPPGTANLRRAGRLPTSESSRSNSPVGRDEAEFSLFRRHDLPRSGREAAGGPSRLPRYGCPSACVSNFENPVVPAGGGVVRAVRRTDDRGKRTPGSRPPKRMRARRSSSSSFGAVGISLCVTVIRSASGGSAPRPSGTARSPSGRAPSRSEPSRSDSRRTGPSRVRPASLPDLPRSRREVTGGPPRRPLYDGSSARARRFETRYSTLAAPSSGGVPKGRRR